LKNRKFPSLISELNFANFWIQYKIHDDTIFFIVIVGTPWTELAWRCNS